MTSFNDQNTINMDKGKAACPLLFLIFLFIFGKGEQPGQVRGIIGQKAILLEKDSLADTPAKEPAEDLQIPQNSSERLYHPLSVSLDMTIRQNFRIQDS